MAPSASLNAEPLSVSCSFNSVVLSCCVVLCRCWPSACPLCVVMRRRQARSIGACGLVASGGVVPGCDRPRDRPDIGRRLVGLYCVSGLTRGALLRGGAVWLLACIALTWGALGDFSCEWVALAMLPYSAHCVTSAIVVCFACAAFLGLAHLMVGGVFCWAMFGCRRWVVVLLLIVALACVLRMRYLLLPPASLMFGLGGSLLGALSPPSLGTKTISVFHLVLACLCFAGLGPGSCASVACSARTFLAFPSHIVLCLARGTSPLRHRTYPTLANSIAARSEPAHASAQHGCAMR